MSKINWNTVGQPDNAWKWWKPCCCVFVGSGLPMDMKDCPVHTKLVVYECCGDSGNVPCPSHCTEYRPKYRTPRLRLEYLGEPAHATGWSVCVCGHPAQYHG